MKRYIVYDKTTGRIRRMGIGSTDPQDHFLKENEAVMGGVASSQKHCIIDGKICPITEELLNRQKLFQEEEKNLKLIIEEMNNISYKQAVENLKDRGAL